MNDLQGFMFFIVLIIILILLFVGKAFYDLWATSITLKLLQNNQNNFSIKRIIIWLGVIVSIAFILNKFNKNKE